MKRIFGREGQKPAGICDIGSTGLRTGVMPGPGRAFFITWREFLSDMRLGAASNHALPEDTIYDISYFVSCLRGGAVPAQQLEARERVRESGEVLIGRLAQLVPDLSNAQALRMTRDAFPKRRSAISRKPAFSALSCLRVLADTRLIFAMSRRCFARSGAAAFRRPGRWAFSSITTSSSRIFPRPHSRKCGAAGAAIRWRGGR